MNNFFSDDFLISSYLNKPVKNEKEDMEKIARDWSEETGIVIITKSDSIKDLDEQWYHFNEMIKKKRRESDWKSIELFGVTNQERYDAMRSELSRKDDGKDIDMSIDQNIQDPSQVVNNESFIDTTHTYYEDRFNYDQTDIDKAIEWSNESGKAIIVPTRTLQELEKLWDSFNMMIKKHKRESDWKSLDIFGVTNLRHYEYLKSEFLKKDIDRGAMDYYPTLIESCKSDFISNYMKSAYISNPLETTKSLLEMTTGSDGIYEDVLVKNIISDVMDKSDMVASDSELGDFCGDMPYYTPDQMVDMGVYSPIDNDNFFGVASDNSELNDTITTKKWFDEYCIYYKGISNDFPSMSSDWVNKVRTLMSELSKIDKDNENAIKSKKQSILELGWNPDVEFSPNNRIIASEIYRMENNRTPVKFVNLTEFYAASPSDAPDEGEKIENKRDLYPIFVILTQGKTKFSELIQNITNSMYSHASIALGPNLDKMYSYGIVGKGLKGGFREEDVKKLPIGCKVGVYVCFVPKYVLAKVHYMIESFKANSSNSSYSYENLFTYLLKIPMNKDYRLICSQFVDMCLKAAGIDITKKDSSLVAPADMEKALDSNKYMYEIYNGFASKYNPNKTKNLLNTLINKATPIKENFADITDETRYIYAIMNNIDRADQLISLESKLYLVKNPTVRNIIESSIFDRMNLRPYCEAKKFPVQFDKDGNLLIKNIKRIDFDQEYFKSHELLKHYKEADNVEGIKYELSKLTMMRDLIQSKLHSKEKLKSDEISKLNKSKARIINDIKHYMNIVLISYDPKFNFTEYYENSPFSSAFIQIDGTTITGAGKLIKSIVKGIGT